MCRCNTPQLPRRATTPHTKPNPNIKTVRRKPSDLRHASERAVHIHVYGNTEIQLLLTVPEHIQSKSRLWIQTLDFKSKSRANPEQIQTTLDLKNQSRVNPNPKCLVQIWTRLWSVPEHPADLPHKPACGPRCELFCSQHAYMV